MAIRRNEMQPCCAPLTQCRWIPSTVQATRFPWITVENGLECEEVSSATQPTPAPQQLFPTWTTGMSSALRWMLSNGTATAACQWAAWAHTVCLTMLCLLLCFVLLVSGALWLSLKTTHRMLFKNKNMFFQKKTSEVTTSEMHVFPWCSLPWHTGNIFSCKLYCASCPAVWQKLNSSLQLKTVEKFQSLYKLYKWDFNPSWPH